MIYQITLSLNIWVFYNLITFPTLSNHSDTKQDNSINLATYVSMTNLLAGNPLSIVPTMRYPLNHATMDFSPSNT